jgi:hypothetical protein
VVADAHFSSASPLMAADKSSGSSEPRPAEKARDGDAAPPAYSPVANAPPPSGPPKQLSSKELAELSAAFSSLSIPSVITKVDESTCLAHLKLLFAFHNLKEDVGYTDGLWDILDSKVDSYKAADDKDADPAAVLARLREKRWALYVARAVDRYETWWNCFPSDQPLLASDVDDNTPAYSNFTSSTRAITWTPQMLPPLGT